MNRPTAVGLVVIGLLCISPVYSSAKPNSKQSLEKLMVFFQNSDLNNIIRSSLYYQRQLNQVLSNNPKSLHANIKREFYAEKKKAIFAQEDPNARGFGQDPIGRALFGGVDVDPSDAIWSVLRFFKAGSRWDVTEVTTGTTNDGFRRIPIHVGYVRFRFKSWESAPHVENKYLKEAIVKIELVENAEYFTGLGRVAKGDVYWTGDVTPPVKCSANSGGPVLPKSLFDKMTGMEFVFVPCGCYKMGDIFGDGYKDEKPAHDVCVSDFYLGKYEVTQGEWEKVIGNFAIGIWGNSLGNRKPVFNISWNDAQEFISRLNFKSGQNYRLPTEAEWEYAARSGGRKEKWPGTNDESSLKSYAVDHDIAPVGSRKPNEIGIHDMAGNLEEWCGDWYDENYYSSSFKNDPQGPPGGTGRVLRGGNKNSSPDDLRTAKRSSQHPANRGGFVSYGIRLARPATSEGLDGMGIPGETPVSVAGNVGAAKTVSVPDYVREYKAVIIAVLVKDKNILNEYNIPLNSMFSIPGESIALLVDYYLPHFVMNDKGFTSESPEPKNPAVYLTVFEGGREIFKNWIYANHPEINSLQHSKYAIRLIAGAKTHKNENTLESRPIDTRDSISKVRQQGHEMPFKEGTTWVGDYVCGQMKTELSIDIIHVKDDNVKGIFRFFHSPTGVRGSFYVSGRYNSKENRLKFLPYEWIEHPPGYQTVGMEGLVLSNPVRFEGRILNQYCGEFSARLSEKSLEGAERKLNDSDFRKIPEMQGWTRVSRGQSNSGYTYNPDGTLAVDGKVLKGKFEYQADELRKAPPFIAEELTISPRSPSGKFIMAIAAFDISGDRLELLGVIYSGSIVLVEPGSIGREFFSRWIRWSTDEKHALLLSSYEEQSMSVIDLSDPKSPKLYYLSFESKNTDKAVYSREDYIWHDVDSFRFEDGGKKISGRIIITCDQHQDENCDMTKVKRAFNMTSDKYFSNIALQPID